MNVISEQRTRMILDILNLCRDKEKLINVSGMAERLGLGDKMAYVSRKIGDLEDKGLIRTQRVGNVKYIFSKNDKA